MRAVRRAEPEALEIVELSFAQRAVFGLDRNEIAPLARKCASGEAAVQAADALRLAGRAHRVIDAHPFLPEGSARVTHFADLAAVGVQRRNDLAAKAQLLAVDA